VRSSASLASNFCRWWRATKAAHGSRESAIHLLLIQRQGIPPDPHAAKEKAETIQHEPPLDGERDEVSLVYEIPSYHRKMNCSEASALSHLIVPILGSLTLPLEPARRLAV
jgi:hypothetical protein